MRTACEQPFSWSCTLNGRGGPWLRLLAGIGVLLFIMFVVAPLLGRLPVFSSMREVIDRDGIRATAIYYTDVKEFGDALSAVSDRMNFGPEETPPKAP